MDDDNIDELAIMFEDGSILILRKDGTSVIGFNFGLRGMSEISTDGSNSTSYYINGKTVSKNEFETLYEKGAETGIEWDLFS